MCSLTPPARGPGAKKKPRDVRQRRGASFETVIPKESAMQILTSAGARDNASALAALHGWLMDQHYSQHATEQIVAHTALEGTPTGCPYLDRESEETATEVFIEAMPPVDPFDAAWDTPDALLDVELLAEGTHPTPFPEEVYHPSEEDLADYDRWLADLERRREREAEAVPPVAGGAPEPEMTPEEALLEEVRAWYRRHPISEFNAMRPDFD
jgi:hypothetical protein